MGCGVEWPCRFVFRRPVEGAPEGGLEVAVGGVPGVLRERCRAPRGQAPWRGLTSSLSG